MKILAQARQTGKTEKLIVASAEQNIPIVTNHIENIHYIKHRANELGLAIPEPLTIRDAMNTKLLGSTKTVLIDDAEWVLNHMMKEICGVEADTIAVTLRDKDGYEMLPDGRSIKDIMN